MGRKLAKTVTLMDDSGNFQKYLKGTEPDEEVAGRITNPAAWVPEEDSPERNPDHSWPPDGGFESMSDEEIFLAANSTSSSTGEGDRSDLRTQKATGDHDPSETYRKATIPQLRTMAEERELDTQGLTRRRELVDLLEKDDARNK